MRPYSRQCSKWLQQLTFLGTRPAALRPAPGHLLRSYDASARAAVTSQKSCISKTPLHFGCRAKENFFKVFFKTFKCIKTSWERKQREGFPFWITPHDPVLLTGLYTILHHLLSHSDPFFHAESSTGFSEHLGHPDTLACKLKPCQGCHKMSQVRCTASHCTLDKQLAPKPGSISCYLVQKDRYRTQSHTLCGFCKSPGMPAFSIQQNAKRRMATPIFHGRIEIALQPLLCARHATNPNFVGCTSCNSCSNRFFADIFADHALLPATLQKTTSYELLHSSKT